MRVLQLNLALRVAALYALFGGLWVLFSDRLLLTLVADPLQLVEISMVKGWGFVAASAALIYLLLRYELKQRFQTEKTLRESEERFRAIADYTYDWENWFDPNGKLIWVNPAVSRFTGYSVDECLSMPDFPMPLIDEADRERMTRLFAAAIQGQSDNDVEFRVRCKDGSLKWATASWQPLFDSRQTNLGYRSSQRDITERKRAEEALQASEARYWELFSHMNNGVAVYKARADGADFIFMDCNQASERIDKVRKEDLIGKSIVQVFPGVREFGLFDVFQRVWKTGESEHHPISLYKDERLVGWRENYVYKLSSGEIVAIYDDLTERKRAEEQIAYLAQLLATVNDAIVASDAEYRLTAWNAAAESMYGWKAEEVLGWFELDITHTEFLGVDKAEMLRAIAERGSWRGEVTQTRKDGTRFSVELSSVVLRDAIGKVTGFVSMNRDITARKRVEQQLAASAAQLRALSRRLVKTQETERRSIARELHDEVGQVILAVKTNLETMQLIQEPETLNERLAASINIVSRALEQIRALALNLRPSLLDDFGLMTTLEWYLERQAKDAPFKINFQTDLPDKRFPPDIETNCFRVTQAALTNITRHAQATQAEVTLRLIPDAQVLELSVRDDGVGFDVPAALERARHGESLGLLGMQERVQLIGGQIAIESAPGRGTEIRARVPIKAEGIFSKIRE